MLKYVLAVLLSLAATPAYAAVITTVEWESKPGAPWAYSGTVIDCTVTPSPSGGCALKFTYPAGTYPTSFSGGRAAYEPGNLGKDIYFGAWMRYSSPFQFHTNGQKMDMYYLAGTFTGGPGCRNIGFGYYQNGFSATPQICWATSTYNQRENIGSWDEQAALNQWHWYEQHIKIPSSGGAYDGVAEMWVDDVLKLRYTNMHFPAPGDEAGLGVLQHTAEYGGGPSVINTTQYWWVDHTVISTTRIGTPGGASPPNDTTPPTPPTALTAQ